ncbi:hypothetical protein [Pseudomonas sp. B1-22]|uniref:hypothetical protein n=1 Tax=Pseudomonas sp. B1-22 TaxID=3141456 RepID=UPI003D267829
MAFADTLRRLRENLSNPAPEFKRDTVFIPRRDLLELLDDWQRLDGQVRSQHAEAQENPGASGYDRLWLWFGLTHSAYAVLPRVMMHAMPDDWQGRMAALLDEWNEAWPNQPDISAHIQIKRANRFIKTPPWLLNYRHPDVAQLESMRATKSNE